MELLKEGKSHMKFEFQTRWRRWECDGILWIRWKGTSLAHTIQSLLWKCIILQRH